MKRRLIIPLAAVLTLTGCSFGASIDTLMSPPKLSAEQEQIYNALTSSVGTSISLKYPKSGNYLSAFIMEDIDGDGGNEAIVFYEKNGMAVEENALRIKLFDKNAEGGWSAVADEPLGGAEIERVMISKLGDNDRVNIIIGSSMVNRTEKSVAIYNYNEGKFSGQSFGSYYYFSVTDLDGNGQNEFLRVTGDSSGGNTQVKAYKLSSGGKYSPTTAELSGGFTEFENFSYGQLPDGSTGLYIDALSGSGNIQTDVICMKDGALKRLFSSPESLRPAGWDSSDVDGDDTIEIPFQDISPGYEGVTEGEQMKLTRWMTLNQEGKLERLYGSYYSPSDGYIFLFPEKWRSRVTVSRDALNDELLFCAYNSATGEMGRTLLQIYCAEDTASREDHISAGYMLLHTKGDLAYLAYIPQYTGPYDDDLSITAADAAINFISV